MAAPPPYEGPCKECDRANEPSAEIPKHGQYRGICVACRPVVLERRRNAREARVGPVGEDGMEDEIRNRQRQPPLSSACDDLTKQAVRLEEALADRKRATVHAKAEVGSFKECLAIVGRVAQSLVNGSGTASEEP